MQEDAFRPTMMRRAGRRLFKNLKGNAGLDGGEEAAKPSKPRGLALPASPDQCTSEVNPDEHGQKESIWAEAAALATGDLPHLERLRNLEIRFGTGGHKTMLEDEILELLLYSLVPQKHVRPLSERLLIAFGDLNGVVAASEHCLLKINGATSCVHLQLKIVEAFAHRMAHARLLRKDVLSSWDDLVAYCRTTMANRETEQFRVLYLNRSNTVTAHEEQTGTVDHVSVYPREVAKRALELNASGVILAHNHPSGDPTPSLQDIELTHRVIAACRAIGVDVHDHIVIGKDREVSLRSEGFLTGVRPGEALGHRIG